MALERFVPGHRGPEFVDEEVACCVFHGSRMFVTRDASGRPGVPVLDARAHGLSLLEGHYLGRLNGRHCYGLQLPPDARLPEPL